MAAMPGITMRIDASKLERAIRDSQRSTDGTPRPPKFILGEEFIAALIANGLLPRGTTYVRITAEIAEPIRVDFETIGDEGMLAVAEAMVETDDASKAVAK